jgi:hypothetical protein
MLDITSALKGAMRFFDLFIPDGASQIIDLLGEENSARFGYAFHPTTAVMGSLTRPSVSLCTAMCLNPARSR